MQLPSTKGIERTANAVATSTEVNRFVRSMEQTGWKALQVSAATGLEEEGSKTKRRDGFILKLERNLPQGSSGFAQHKYRSENPREWKAPGTQ